MAKNNGLSDAVKGTVSKIKGEAQDQIGNATGDKSLQARGKLNKVKGSIQEKIGESKNKKK